MFAKRGSKVPPPPPPGKEGGPLAKEDWGKQPHLPFPRNLSLPVRFYRAMFINPNLNPLAALDPKLAKALHGQVEFWVHIDVKFRDNPRANIQDIVKVELTRIFEVSGENGA